MGLHKDSLSSQYSLSLLNATMYLQQEIRFQYKAWFSTFICAYFKQEYNMNPGHNNVQQSDCINGYNWSG
jgi:hypothetical protein